MNNIDQRTQVREHLRSMDHGDFAELASGFLGHGAEYEDREILLQWIDTLADWQVAQIAAEIKD